MDEHTSKIIGSMVDEATQAYRARCWQLMLAQVGTHLDSQPQARSQAVANPATPWRERFNLS